MGLKGSDPFNCDSNQGLAGALLSALVEQVAGSLTDRTPGVARTANNMAINKPGSGLLNGPYIPDKG